MSRWPWFLLLCPALTACSNFTTQTYDPSAVTPSSPPPGLPFTLNKPQFTITHTPATPTAPESYAVVPSYVPDPESHFATRMTPFWTASIDWTVTYDGSGSFVGTNGKATDQSVATLGSLAKLALSIAAVADTDKKSDDETLAEIDRRVKKDLVAGKICCGPDHKLRTLKSTDPKDFAQRWQAMGAVMKPLADAGQLATYLYQSDEERTLLRTALHTELPSFDTKVQPTIQGAQEDDRQLIVDHPGTEQLDQYTLDQAAAQIRAAYETFDIKKLQAIQSAAIAARTQQRQKLTLVSAKSETYDTNKLMRFQNMIISWSTKAITALKTWPNDTLFALAEPDSATWEAKVVSDLNDKINAQSQIDRANAVSAKPAIDVETADPLLIELKRRKAAVLGLAAVYDQTLALQKVSAADPKEFKAAQDELAVLLKQLADAEAALSTTAAATTADPAFLADAIQANFPLPADGCHGWLKDQTHGLPDYVIVVAPLGAAACPGVRPPAQQASNNQARPVQAPPPGRKPPPGPAPVPPVQHPPQ